MRKSPRLFQRCLSLCLLSSLLVLAAGCGSKGGTVSGKVYYKDKPLPAGSVQFFPEGKGGDFSSPIKEDGSYSISKVPPGPVKITVIVNTGNPTAANMPPMARGKGAQAMKNASEMMKKGKEGGEGGGNPFEMKKGISIPPNYGNPETSNLKLDVTGGNQPYDIKLD
jgi:hypothetical protein